MFDFFNKKTVRDPELLKHIEEDGIEYASMRLAQVLMKRTLPNKEVAYEFLLQELDGARQGTDYAKEFVDNCGIDKKEYYGRLKKDTPEVDDAQDFINDISARLMPLLDLSIEIRIRMLDEIMKYYSFGKYGNNQKDIIFTNPFEPTIDVNTPDAVIKYMENLSSLSLEQLYIEFCNVMSAKYNCMNTGLNRDKNQEIITDLTDKSTMIVIYLFGQKNIKEFCNGNFKIVNQLIMDCDNKVAQRNLSPKEHGKQLVEELKQYIL